MKEAVEGEFEDFSFKFEVGQPPDVVCYVDCYVDCYVGLRFGRETCSGGGSWAG